MAEKIGQILIRKGKITPARLRDALRTQQFFGGYLGSHLINLGFIDEASLGETLSEIYRVPFAPYESIRLANAEAIAKVPAALAQRFRVIPIQIDGPRLHLAMLNPRDAAAIKAITAATGLTIAPWVAPEFRIAHALDKHYKIRRERRITVRPSADEAAPSALEPPASAMAAADADREAGRKEAPRTEPELGLDGHPLDAKVLPDLGGTVRTPTEVEWVPRSLQEWREESEPDSEEKARVRGPDRKKAPAATSTVRRSATAEPSRAGRTPAVGTDADRAPAGSSREAVPLSPAAAAGAETGMSARAGTRAPSGAARMSAAEDTASAHASSSRMPLVAGAVSVQDGAPDYDKILHEVSAATSREELVTGAIGLLSQHFRRAVAFLVRNADATAFAASPGLDLSRLAAQSVPLDKPSPISSAQNVSSVHITQPQESAQTRAFLEAMGGPARSALVIPVILRERLVIVFYADNADEPLDAIDLDLWTRLVRVCTISLEIFILKNRMRGLGS